MNQSNLWEPSRRIEQMYLRALKRLTRTLLRLVRGKSPGEMTKALEEFASSDTLNKFAEAVAMKMVTGLFRDVGRSWRQAAAKNGKGKELYQELMRELRAGRGVYLDQLIRENTYRIKTLPADLGKDVASYVEREGLKGRRASEIEIDIRKMFPEHTAARAELIARTQVSYTQTNLIRTRAEGLGLQWYVWRAVGGGQGDGRTRSAHRKMSGVLVNWNDPPAPEDLFPTIGKDGRPYKNSLGHYHAGQAPNCRCYPEAVVDIDELTFPVRVYRGGRIFTMNRQQFEMIMG